MSEKIAELDLKNIRVRAHEIQSNQYRGRPRTKTNSQ